MVRIVHTESSTVMGGQERRVLAESVGMRERGHTVWVATPGDGALAVAAGRAGLDVIPMSFRRPSLLLTAWRLRDLFRRLEPDIVNSHSSADSWPCALAHTLGRQREALVRTRHISAPVRPGALHRFLYGRPDHVITTGERIRLGLAAAGLVPPDRSSSIATAVDTALYRPSPGVRARSRAGLDLDANTPVVGVVAFLRGDKGHTVLLDAMPAIRSHHPGVVLLIIGDGPEHDALAAQASRLGIADCSRFLGRREDVADLLPAFDVFCLPSLRNEGVPQALVQASASGLPVVSTDVGGITEALRSGETGLLVPAGDSDAISAAVSALLSDAALRERMGRMGRAHVQATFSPDGMLDRTEQAYEAALGTAAKRRSRP